MLIDTLSRQLINAYQGGFPLSPYPFSSVAQELGTDETTLISTLESLLEKGILSRFGPLYDAARLGGAFTLAALQVPQARFETVSKQINECAEIAHNYRRDHQLNMWFVVACDKAESIQDCLNAVRAMTRLTVYNFPKIREFYIGLWLELDPQGNVMTKPVPVRKNSQAYTIDQLDRDIIKLTQSGLPLVSEPYAEIARQIDSRPETVFIRLGNMLKSGIIRRIGVVPNHYKLGLKGNGMSVWNVPDEAVEELGQIIGSLDFVSHAYQRPRHMPIWPYNLFAMVHGQDRQEVRDKVSKIAVVLNKALGNKPNKELTKERGDAQDKEQTAGPANVCCQHDILFSSAILKKTGMRLVA